MSKQEQCENRDYSKFDGMSTEALKVILRADSQRPDNEESDIDAIMYITEVVASREIKIIKENVSDVNTAWKTFNESYRPYAGDGKSLYEDDEDTNSPSNIEAIPFKAIKHSQAKRKGQGLLRAASVAAIIVVLAFAGTVTSYALGYDLWGDVARWSKETFGFIHQDSIAPEGTHPSSNNESFSDMQSALDEHEINQKMVPTYFPDGYEQSEFYVEDIGYGVQFLLSLEDGDEMIIIDVTKYTNQVAGHYQKDDGDPEVYIKNGIDHYIMTNMEKYLVVWRNGMLEGSISGVDTKDELIKMIDSIYY